MQEHIYRAQESESKQRNQLQQKHAPPQQLSKGQVHVNVEQQQQQQQRNRQQQQVLQSRIVTPTKTAQYELLAVKEVFYQVEEAFKARESEKNKLQDQIIEKENQIKYCEEETKKQAEAIGVLTASNSFRSHKLNQLDLDCNRFNDDVVDPLRARCKDMEEKLAIGNEMVDELVKDLAPLTMLANRQRNLAEILSLKLADIEEKDEAEILALSVAVTHHQAIETRLQALQEELKSLKLRKDQIDCDFKAAEQHLANAIQEELERKKSLEMSEESLQELTVTLNNADEAMKIEISTAKDSVANSEAEEQKLEDEMTILRREIASQEEIQAGVLIVIQELEAEKDSNRKCQMEANERMSNHVLQRRRLASLALEAKERGDNLKEEVMKAAVDLKDTTDRAKEYERNMQDSYMLMGQNMAAQYELQKLEPALRCELYQLQMALSNKICALSSAAESADSDALAEENTLIVITEEIKERTSELEMLQKDVTRELDEIENLKAQNASVSERIRELASLELHQRAHLESQITEMSSIQIMEDEFNARQMHLVEANLRTSHLRQQCADGQSQMETESVLLASNSFPWEPSESSRNDVAVSFERENLCMMQDLDADFRMKETEIIQHTNKLKEGFKIPAAWGAKIDNITSDFVQQEDLNDQVRIEIEDADDKILHLTASQDKVEGQILTLQSQINDLTAASASEKNQNGKERAITNIDSIATKGEEFDDDDTSQGSLDLDSEVQAEDVLSQSIFSLTEQIEENGELEHISRQERRSQTHSQTLGKHQMQTQTQMPMAMPMPISTSKGKESKIQKFQGSQRISGTEEVTQIVDSQTENSHKKAKNSKNRPSKSNFRALPAGQDKSRICESQPTGDVERDHDNRGKSASQDQQQIKFAGDDIVSHSLQQRPRQTLSSSSSSIDPEYTTTKDGLDRRNVPDSKKLKARHLNDRNKAASTLKQDMEEEAKKLDSPIKDDDGWVTESSACFEDTLFGDAPKKPRAASEVKGNKLSSSTAAFVPFGESAATTTYKNFMEARNQTASSASSKSESQAAALNPVIDQSSVLRRSIPGHQSAGGTKNVSNVASQRVQTTPLVYGSKGIATASSIQPIEVTRVKVNAMSPPAMPSTIHEKNSSKLVAAKATSSKVYQAVSKTTASISVGAIKKSNLINSRNVVPARSKPLSSIVPVSSKKSDADNLKSRNVKRAVSSISSDVSDSLKRPSIYSGSSQGNLMSEGKSAGRLQKGNKSSNIMQDSSQPEDSKMTSSQQKGTKGASPGDWFDDDIKF